MSRQKLGTAYLLIGLSTALLCSNTTYAESKEACDALFVGMSKVENKENCGFIGAGLIGYKSPFTNDTEANLIPFTTVVWESFYIDGAEAGLLFWDNVSLSGYYLATAFVRLASDGYSVDDEPQLIGLKDTDEVVEAGVKFNWGSKWGEIQVSVAHDISSEHESFVADIGYVYGWQISDITVALSLSAAFQSSDAANYYYGVNADQVLENRPLYESGSLVNLSAGYFVDKPINNYWHIIHFAQFTRYSDDVKDSPLTVNDNGLSAGLGVTYAF
ncbi:MipA/OmpV family protein [Paraglaciecola sp.]|uniref:MipA/OmpV family protein n=1 Tax=Paraglaciecola sp. TaxID=1920173 RepID=UPI0030F42840